MEERWFSSAMSVLVQLNDYKKSEGQIKYVVVHNELSPFIHEVKMASPPFWGPHCLWASPLVLQTQIQRKNM